MQPSLSSEKWSGQGLTCRTGSGAPGTEHGDGGNISNRDNRWKVTREYRRLQSAALALGYTESGEKEASLECTYRLRHDIHTYLLCKTRSTRNTMPSTSTIQTL